MLNSYDENRKMIFAARLKGLIKNWEQANGEQLSQGKLAEKLYFSRESVNGWLNGKRIPDKKTIAELCKFFSVPAEYFSAQLEDEIFVNESLHKELAAEAETTALQIGLSENFLQFIKENPSLADAVLSHAQYDALLQSNSPAVPENKGCPYQFISSSGEKIYLPEEMLLLLRIVQRDLIQYAEFLIQKWSKVLSDSHKEALQGGGIYESSFGSYFEKTGKEYTPARVRLINELNGYGSLSGSAAKVAHWYSALDSREQTKALNDMYSAYRHKNRTREERAIKQAVRFSMENSVPVSTKRIKAFMRLEGIGLSFSNDDIVKIMMSEYPNAILSDLSEKLKTVSAFSAKKGSPSDDIQISVDGDSCSVSVIRDGTEIFKC